MEYVGPIGNAQFAFSDGLLTGFRILTHRKRFQDFKEAIFASGPVEMGPIEHSPYRPDSSLTSGSGNSSMGQTRWVATQQFGAGHRTFEVQINPAADQEELVNELSSTVTVSHNLDEPVSWEVRMAGATVEQSTDPHHWLLRQSQNVTIEISSDVSLSVTADSSKSDGLIISAALPLGQSQIRLNVISSPYFPILDTAVVCRPSQLREAALVLSCLPSDQFIPLIVAEPPALSAEQYNSIYASFLEAHDKSMVDVAGMGAEQTLEGSAENSRRVIQQIVDHWKLQDELTPYRSWIRRNQQLANLLFGSGLKNVVVLFPAKQSDFETINPEILSREPEAAEQKNRQFPPKNCKIICFLKDSEPHSELSNESVTEYRYSSLTELSEVAWDKLHGTPRPPNTIEIAEEEDWAYLLALHDALRQQVPLRPASGVPLKARTERSRAARADNADGEVVLVEFTGQARDLVGVLYAHFRGVKLVLTPTPDLMEVDQALANFDETQFESARARHYVAAYAEHLQELDQLTDSEKAEIKRAIEPSQYPELSDYTKSDLVNFVRRFFLTDWETEGLAKIEAAVTRQIPEYVVDEVGDRALTVFTCGLPYAFLKRGEINWTEHTIGHVVNDPDLMIIRELFLAGAPRSIFSLSAIFDPGFFQNSETEDVLRSLDDHLTHALVLEGPVASITALQAIGDLRQLEFLFFNTHGSDNAIMLDMPLRSSLVVQWVSFGGNPIVFNNSCLSWRGVGREFIRIGARGYVGTLWSVDSKDAAMIARKAMTRLTAHSTSVPASLCNIPVRPGTRRAYIFVGTCNVFLDDWAEVSERHRYEYVRDGSEVFSALLQRSAAAKGQFTAYAEQAKKLVQLFHQQLGNFLERLEELRSDDSTPLFHGRYSELLVLADDSGILETTAEYDQRVIDLCKSYLGKLDLTSDERKGLEAGISQAEARINYRLGKIFEAIDILERSAGEVSEDSSKNLPGLIELLKSSGQVEKAIEVGLKAKEFYQKTNDKVGHITVVGQLCQLYKRTGELDKALEIARFGFALAEEIGQKFRQPIFKLDECNILQLQGRYDEAIEAAHSASRLFRIHHEDRGDLRCYGVIGQCYLEKGDLKAARKWLSDGYEFAKKWRDPVEEANFAGDLGNLEAMLGNIEASSKYHLEAFGLFLKIGHYEAIPIVLTRMIRPALQHRNYELFSYTLATQILMSATLSPVIAGSAIPVIYRCIKDMVDLTDPKDSNELAVALRAAWQFGVTITRSSKETPDHLRFLLEIISVFGLWLEGNSEEALKRARALDQASRGVLGIEKLVSVNPS